MDLGLPQTVLLHHLTRTGSHYDWLLELPPLPLACPDPVHRRLWAFRTAIPSWGWKEVDSWPLERIADHRRLYLTWQGILTGGRGQVRRVDEGRFELLRFTSQMAMLDLHTQHFQGRLLLKRTGAHQWRAVRVESGFGDSSRTSV